MIELDDYKKLILISLVGIVLLFASFVSAVEPPGTFPDPEKNHIWEMTPQDFLMSVNANSAMSHFGVVRNAFLPAPSPNGKWLAYVKSGPYLRVKRRNPNTGIEKFSEPIIDIPWGLKPVWSPDSRWIYYMKMEEGKIPEDAWLDWFKYSEGMYRVNVFTREKEKVTDKNDCPSSFGYGDRSHIMFFSRNEEFGDSVKPWIHTLNTKTGEVTDQGVYGRFPVTSPDGNIAYTGYPHSIVYVFTENDWELSKDDKISYFAKKTPYAIFRDFNKTGSFVMMDMVKTHKKYDPRNPNKYFWVSNYYDANQKAFGSFDYGNLTLRQANFQRGTNWMFFVTEIGW